MVKTSTCLLIDGLFEKKAANAAGYITRSRDGKLYYDSAGDDGIGYQMYEPYGYDELTPEIENGIQERTNSALDYGQSLVDKHPRRQDVLQEMDYNDERRDLKSKFSAPVRNTLGFGIPIASMVGVGALNKKLGVPIRSNMGKTFFGGLIGGAIAGTSTEDKINEHYRKKMGYPEYKYDVQNEVEDEINKGVGEKYLSSKKASDVINGLFEKHADEIFGPTTMIAAPLLAGAAGISLGEKLYDVFKKAPQKQDNPGYQMPEQSYSRQYELNQYLENDPKTLEIYESLEDPQYDNMTVGDFEQLHRQMVSDLVDSRLQKTASSKAGIATGVLGGLGLAGGTWLGYTTKRDGDKWNSSSKNYIPADKDDVVKAYGVGEYEKDPETIKKHLYNSIHSDAQWSEHVFSPYLNQYDPDDSGMGGFAEEIDQELANRGVDRNTLNVRDYRDLLTKVTPRMAWEYDEYYNSPEMDQDIDDFVAGQTANKRASNVIDSLFEKLAAGDIGYHASPVQGITKFRFGEDTSGNNKGRVIFTSKDTAFCSAFGVRWNDTNARLVVETTNQKPPTNSNYKRTVLKITDDIDLDKPCSMYTLRGKFKPLRYADDIEEYTNDPVEIISEEKFSSFKEMAKHYGLEIKDVKESTIMRGLKDKKTSNFEKGAKALIDELFEKEAGVASNFMGRNISKAQGEANVAAEALRTSRADLAGKTRRGFFGKTKPMYGARQIDELTANEQRAANVAQENVHKQVGKTFNTRLGAGAVGGGTLAYQMKQKQPLENPDVNPNYNSNYQPDNYMYMNASEAIDDLFEKTAAGMNFSAAHGRLSRLGEIATFGAARKAQAGVNHVTGHRSIMTPDAEGFAANKNFLRTLRRDNNIGARLQQKLDIIDKKIKSVSDPNIVRAYNPNAAGKLRSGMFLGKRDTRARVGQIYEEADNTAKDLARTRKYTKKMVDWNKEDVGADMKTLKNYRDNEIAKGLALYGGVGLTGKGVYDLTRSQDKSASEILDELYKEAGFTSLLQAQREVGAAKKALKRMNHRNALAENNHRTLQNHMDFMDSVSANPASGRMGKLDEYYKLGQSRLKHSGERVQNAAVNLNSAQQKRNDEVKNLFSVGKSKEGIPNVL
jgi:hypothetical protein